MLSPGLLLDGASGLVLVAFGVLASLVRPRTRALTAFAVFAAAFGVRAFNTNIVHRLYPLDGVLAVSAVAYLISAVAFAWFGVACVGAAALRRRDMAGALALGALPATLFAAAIWPLSFPWVLKAEYFGAEVANGALLGVLVLLAAAARAPARRGLVLVAVGVSLWPFLDSGLFLSLAAPVFAPWFGYAGLAVVALASLPWLAAARDVGRGAVLLAFAPPALCLAGLLLSLALDDPYNSGLLGAARTMSVVLLAFAFARGGLLGGRLALRRGTVAAMTLAIVIMVAQVAQNFLEAQYGVLLGGIIAGALLFVATPLQRAVERALDGSLRQGHDDAREREEAFRDAVRLVVVVRAPSREDDRRLLRLAQRLGIPPTRAMELQDEVERERAP